MFCRYLHAHATRCFRLNCVLFSCTLLWAVNALSLLFSHGYMYFCRLRFEHPIYPCCCLTLEWMDCRRCSLSPVDLMPLRLSARLMLAHCLISHSRSVSFTCLYPPSMLRGNPICRALHTLPVPRTGCCFAHSCMGETHSLLPSCRVGYSDSFNPPVRDRGR